MRTFVVKARVTGAIAAICALGPAAFAHNATDNHTHCSVDGKGVFVDGKTDAQRKASCLRIPDAAWDESDYLKVEIGGPAASSGSLAKPAAPSAPGSGSK